MSPPLFKTNNFINVQIIAKVMKVVNDIVGNGIL